MKRLPFPQRFHAAEMDCCDFEPRHPLDIPNHEDSEFVFEQTYRGRQLFLTREQAFRIAAEHNRARLEKDECYAGVAWLVVVEMLPMPAEWWANYSGSQRNAGMEPHDIPFRIVRPTEAERKQYAVKQAAC
jgi:hypothetical protein